MRWSRLNSVPRSVVDDVWERFNRVDAKEADRLLKRWHRKQPNLLDFVLGFLQEIELDASDPPPGAARTYLGSGDGG